MAVKARAGKRAASPRAKPAHASRRKRSGSRGAPPLRASVAQMRALAHPLRLRILELFAEQPRTTMSVAELLGQPPTRLYHHVNALERAGLLRLRETRPNRGTVEKWFEAVGGLMGSTQDATTRAKDARPLRALATAALDQARHELAAALAKPGGDRPFAARLVAVGTPEKLAAIRERLRTFIEGLHRECSDEGAVAPGSRTADGASTDVNHRWAMTLVFAPVWPSAPANAGANTKTRSARARRPR